MTAVPISPHDARIYLDELKTDLAQQAGHDYPNAYSRCRTILEGLLAYHARGDALEAASLDAIKLRREIAVVTARIQRDAFVKVPPLWS